MTCSFHRPFIASSAPSALSCAPSPTEVALAASAAAPLAEADSSSAGCAHRWRSADLLGPARTVEIAHGQTVYRLRLTALGKLILTK